MKTPPDRYIKVGTINTRYWDEGQGQPVLLIHGIGSYIENWLPGFESLAARYHVYAVDLPGHGRTDKSLNTPCEIADLAHFVNEFMRALNIKRAHVVGHSLGGAISTRLALLFPALIDKMVLVASAGLGREGTMMLRIPTLPMVGERLTRPSRASTADFAKFLVHDPAVLTPELLDLAYQMASQPGAQQAFLKTLRANANFFGQAKSMYGPNTAGLGSIRHPVFVIWGRQDRVLPVSHAEVAGKGIPNVRVQVLDNCGHLPMIERAQDFADSLLGFLDA